MVSTARISNAVFPSAPPVHKIDTNFLSLERYITLMLNLDLLCVADHLSCAKEGWLSGFRLEKDVWSPLDCGRKTAMPKDTKTRGDLGG